MNDPRPDPPADAPAGGVAPGGSGRSGALPVVDAPADCEGCGACCRRNGSPVLLYNSGLGRGERHPFRPAGLPAELVEEIDAHFLGLHRGQEGPGPCLWYDAAALRCRHYQWRPQVCRDYAVGSPSCLSDRRKEGV